MPQPVSSPVSEIDELRVVIMRRLTVVMAVLAALVTLGLFLGGAPPIAVGMLFLGILISTGSHMLARANRGLEAVGVIIFGIPLIALVFMSTATDPVLAYGGVEILFVMTLLSAFLSSPRVNTVFVGVGIAVLVVSPIVRSQGATMSGMALQAIFTDVVHFSLLWFGATFLSRTLRETQNALTSRLVEIGDVVGTAKRVAQGDLTQLEAEEDDDARAVMVEMVDGLRDIVVEVRDGVEILRSSAASLGTMTDQHQKGATNQASAVFETQETIESLATSAERIASTSADVLSNAESTLKRSEDATDSMRQLQNFVGSINELLEAIRGVANKSEVLALNASLEGVKAGEAGRGFSLVATEMQRLAENTMGMVGRVKVLTESIDDASGRTLAAISDTNRLAGDTTRAAREISMTTRQQGTGAHQVVEAMRDISAVTGEFASASKASSSAVDELQGLAARLQERLERFTL